MYRASNLTVISSVAILATAAAILLTAGSWFGQAQVTPRLPLDVHSRMTGDNSVIWTVTNMSEKSIVAYTLAIKTDDESAPNCRRSRTVIIDATNKPPNDRLLAGQSREERWNQGRTAQAVPDYVLFEDGSSWGPDSFHQAEFIRGAMSAWKSAKALYRSILEKEGVVGLARELDMK